MTYGPMEALGDIADSIAEFNEVCEQDQHTDTGAAWELLRNLHGYARDALLAAGCDCDPLVSDEEVIVSRVDFRDGVIVALLTPENERIPLLDFLNDNDPTNDGTLTEYSVCDVFLAAGLEVPGKLWRLWHATDCAVRNPEPPYFVAAFWVG